MQYELKVNHPKTHLNQTAGRQRKTLKGKKEKWLITYRASLVRFSTDFRGGYKVVAWYIQSVENKNKQTKNHLSIMNVISCKTFLQKWGGERDQKAGLGRCGKLPPSTKYQKHIHIWSNFNWKLNGNWHKDSYTTKAVKKNQHVIWKNRKKSNQVGTCVPGKGLGVKGRNSPWWVFQRTYWVHQPWRLTQGRQGPLAGWGMMGKQQNWEKPGLCLWVHAHVFTPKARWREWNKTAQDAGWFPVIIRAHNPPWVERMF